MPIVPHLQAVNVRAVQAFCRLTVLPFRRGVDFCSTWKPGLPGASDDGVTEVGNLGSVWTGKYEGIGRFDISMDNLAAMECRQAQAHVVSQFPFGREWQARIPGQT